jgi:acyl transferase domain-containing protein
MDPQHRLLLTSSAQLLAGHGITASGGTAAAAAGAGLADSASVFVAVSWSEYHAICKSHGVQLGPYAAQGAVIRWVMAACLPDTPCCCGTPIHPSIMCRPDLA